MWWIDEEKETIDTYCKSSTTVKYYQSGDEDDKHWSPWDDPQILWVSLYDDRE